MLMHAILRIQEANALNFKYVSQRNSYNGIAHGKLLATQSIFFSLHKLVIIEVNKFMGDWEENIYREKLKKGNG